MVFVDFTKAFDTAYLDALWKVLKSLGILVKMLNVILSFHQGMKADVSDGDLSDSFLTNGTM